MHVDQLVSLLNETIVYLDAFNHLMQNEKRYRGSDYKSETLPDLINRINQAINEQAALKIGHLARS